MQGEVLALEDWKKHEVPLDDEEKRQVRAAEAWWLTGCEQGRSAVSKIKYPEAEAPLYVVDLHERYEAFPSLIAATLRFNELVRTTIRGVWSLQEWWGEGFGFGGRVLVMQARMFSGRAFTLRHVFPEEQVAATGRDTLRDYTFEKANRDLEKTLAKERAVQG